MSDAAKYAITDEAGRKGEHFIRVVDLAIGIWFHFTCSDAEGLRFMPPAVSDPPGPDVPKEPPEQVLAQASYYARQRGWL